MRNGPVRRGGLPVRHEVRAAHYVAHWLEVGEPCREIAIIGWRCQFSAGVTEGVRKQRVGGLIK